MAVMTCQKSYSFSTYYDSCSESGKWFQSSMDLTLFGPCFDADFLVADSTYLKIGFGDGCQDVAVQSSVPAGSVVPTGKDNSIVSTGSTKVIPAGVKIHLGLDLQFYVPSTVLVQAVAATEGNPAI
ncbi:hypothetical protein Tco_0043761 [Tanacetum coccineum]